MEASINSLHHQESDWLRDLDFYDKETDLLSMRLKAVLPFVEGAQKASLEDFDANFKLIKKQCDSLRKENTERYNRLNELAKAVPEQIDESFKADKDVMYRQMDEFYALFRRTRFDFNNYLAKHNK